MRKQPAPQLESSPECTSTGLRKQRFDEAHRKISEGKLRVYSFLLGNLGTHRWLLQPSYETPGSHARDLQQC